jgi:RNA polymerase-binding protein DksA
VAQKRKKTSRKKATSTRTKKGRLSAADIEHFKQILLEKRREIVSSVNEMKDEALKQSRLDASGDLSSMPIHMADIGTDNFEQEFALGLMDSERKLLKEIDDALLRIEERTYGICEGTGKQITKVRLEAKPWARYCVEYARMLEEGLIPEEEQSTAEPQDYGTEDYLEEESS